MIILIMYRQFSHVHVLPILSCRKPVAFHSFGTVSYRTNTHITHAISTCAPQVSIPFFRAIFWLLRELFLDRKYFSLEIAMQTLLSTIHISQTKLLLSFFFNLCVRECVYLFSEKSFTKDFLLQYFRTGNDRKMSFIN